MAFEFVSPLAITSQTQRALACHWHELAAGRRFPAIEDLQPDPGMHDPKQLVIWDVEEDGRQQKFRALYQGGNVSEAFNSAWAGKTMDQVVPSSLRQLTLEAAHECVASGCVVYMIFSTTDSDGSQVDCQRLLLPFGRDHKVEQLLASLQLSSAQKRKNIVGKFQKQSEILLGGKISFESQSAKSGPATSSAKPSGGENRRADRHDVRKSGRISFKGQIMTCMVRDISSTGASLEAMNFAQVPGNFTLVIEMETVERRCRVIWRKNARLGVRFG
jgi:hypothetical protein